MWLSKVLMEMVAVDLPQFIEYIVVCAIVMLLSVVSMLELQLCSVCINEGYFLLSVLTLLTGFSHSSFAGVVAIVNNLESHALKAIGRFIEICSSCSILVGINCMLVCSTLTNEYEMYKWCYLCTIIAFVWAAIILISVAASFAWTTPK